MRAWHKWGLGLLLGAIVLGLIGARLQEQASRNRARMNCRCMSNLKQIGLGMQGYAEDHTETLPSSATWRSDVFPYVKNHALFTCPCGTVYTMNPAVSEVKLSDIKKPSKTVVIYECDGEGNPLFVHYDCMTVAYVDGHVKWIAPEKVAEQVWEP